MLDFERLWAELTLWLSDGEYYGMNSEDVLAKMRELEGMYLLTDEGEK